MHTRPLLLALFLCPLAAASPDVVLTDDEVLRIPAGTWLRAPDGAAGRDVEGIGVVRAGDGSRGGDIILEAPLIVFGEGVVLRPGDGGRGGHATAWGDPGAVAFGGRGAEGGRVILRGHVVGHYALEPSTGGAGGGADAHGGDCSGRDGRGAQQRAGNSTLGAGGSANATGEDGDCGPINGAGGRGGHAYAYGGDAGLTPVGDGAPGGDANATAGRGGDGVSLCSDDPDQVYAWAADGMRAADGGAGGDAGAFGGLGGPAPSGTGGRGGHAYALTEGGNAGNGSYVPAARQGDRTVDEAFVPPGFGGANGVLEVRGGEGGTGVAGGAGGLAHGISRTGDSGDTCLALVPEKTPLPLLALPVLVAIAWRRRQG